MRPGLHPAVAITRRWFEGELIGVEARLHTRRPRHARPPVRRRRRGGRPDDVKLARELTRTTGCRSCRPGATSGCSTRSPCPRSPVRRPAAASRSRRRTCSRARFVDWIVTDWARVVELKRFPYEGWVYSLEVPGPHTFVTTAGLVVHNCFPKDSLALKQLASNSGYHFQLLTAVIEVNELQKRRVVAKLKRHLGSLRGKKVALLGLAFKPNTDDMREAPSIVLASRLLAEGADVRALGPGRRRRARCRRASTSAARCSRRSRAPTRR